MSLVTQRHRRGGARRISVSEHDLLWFPRLADVPGVTYTRPTGLDVSKLRHREVRPEVVRHPGLPASLWWGNTSRAPAGDHYLDDPTKATTAQLLRNVAEALELPGGPGDYHFAIQGVVSLLWSRRAESPKVFAELERLCWLDLRLIQACPEAISYERHNGGMQYYAVEAFDRLMTIYLTEGAVSNAAQVLELADRYGNGNTPSARRTRERCGAFVAEDGGR
jgi:hypothetical protein